MKKWSVESLSLAGILIVVGQAAGVALQVPPVWLVAASGAVILILFTARRQARSRRITEGMLRHSQLRYRDLIDSAHEGICLVDNGAKISFINRRLAGMVGGAGPELLGRALHDILPTFTEAVAQTEHTAKTPLDLRYRRRDGSHGWAIVTSRPLFDDAGKRDGSLLMLTDISTHKGMEQDLNATRAELEERIRARTSELQRANALLRAEVQVRQATEHALALSEQRLHDIITTMPVPLFIKDASSNVTMMNAACEEQWGMRFGEIAGTRGDKWFPPEQIAKFIADDRAVFAQRRLYNEDELAWNSTLRQNRLVQTIKKPIFDRHGAPHSLICISIDITDRKRAEDALQQSYLQLRQLTEHKETIKEEERRRIALDIHDDLGQNLMALKIDVAMLYNRTAVAHPRLNEKVGRVMGTIDATIKSVRAIINDLHPSTLDLGLAAAAEWLLMQFQRRTDKSTQLMISGDGKHIDKRRTAAIFRIMQESLANILRHAQATEVHVTLDLSDECVTLIIADDGIGMPIGAGNKHSTFGLRGIKERVDAFGGELMIDSRPGSGTVLSILIPVGPPEETNLSLPIETIGEKINEITR